MPFGLLLKGFFVLKKHFYKKEGFLIRRIVFKYKITVFY